MKITAKAGLTLLRDERKAEVVWAEKYKVRWVSIIGILYIALNAYLVIKDQYWGFLIPLVLLLVLLYIYKLDQVLLLITLCTPLAVNYRDYDLNLAMSIPTEPMMLGVLLWVLLRIIYSNDFDRRITRHPVSIAIIFSLVWMFITTLTSEMPVVSWKALLSRLWFVVPFFYVTAHMFKDLTIVRKFYWFYIIPFTGVIFYTVYNHALWNFREEPGHWVMTPFYNDHTSYGALLAMFLPLLIGFAFYREYKRSYRLYSFLVCLVFIAALFLSYTRAAWISVAVVVLIAMLISLKVRMRTIGLGFMVLVVLLISFQNQIFMKLEKNKQDSSSDLVEHVQSISNISSDASNLERLNRWNSALRMYRERPWFGWGPGTYQFLYAPFQNSQERTVISTNAGDRGNAHSEYIGPLSESGFIGMLSVIFIVIATIYTGMRVYRNAENREVRFLAFMTLMGLMTYFIHGLLNNFLDTDKASVPFWGFVAVLVAMDIFYPKREKAGQPTSESSGT